MANLSKTPIGSKDLEDYLKSSDDFQLELDVFHSCTKGPFEVVHGGTYCDPKTQKDRQFDIRMRFVRGLCTLKLAIECKNLKPHFPLLVSRIPRAPRESFHDVILSSPVHFERSQKEGGPGAVRYRLDGALFEPKGLVGKSTVQVGRQMEKPPKVGELVHSDAEVYEKWSQAVASAFDLVWASTHDFQDTNQRAGVTVVFPMLVLADDTLWVADYSSDGELIGEPHPCEECSIFLGKDIFAPPQGIDYTFSHLQVFTKTKFDGYLDRIAVNEKYWDRIFPDSLNHILTEFQES